MLLGAILGGVALVASGVCALGTTYYVTPGGADGNTGTSWAQAKQTIQAGVDVAAIAGDEVVVSNGTYILAAAISVPRAITIRGFTGNPADVVVNGNGAVRGFTLTAAAQISGFVAVHGVSFLADPPATCGTV
jgi:hypothetical protein